MSAIELDHNASSAMIGAERRRKIYELAIENGAVSVSELAKSLRVDRNTIRRDLDALNKEGKLVRSHGGAVVKDTALTCPPYLQTRDTRLREKAAIGSAGVKYLPDTGIIFINSGTTTYQLAIRIPESKEREIMTNSPEIALYLTSNGIATTGLLGGIINQDSLASDCSFAEDVLERTFWDVSFLGVEAVDIAHGITCAHIAVARVENKIIEHSRKVVVLCDSSKIGRLSRAMVCPVNRIDVIITDTGISEQFSEELSLQGVRVETVEVSSE